MDGRFEPWILILIVVVIAAAVVFFLRRRRSQNLRTRFGPEYEHTLRTAGHRAAAERELTRRAERVKKLDIRRLPSVECERFADEWRHTQSRFVDDPRGAVSEADALVQRVMNASGYPMGEFEQRAADISVDHPRVVEHYRAAHAIAVRESRGEADTEDLRKSLVHYRALFEDLLGRHVAEHKEVRR